MTYLEPDFEACLYSSPGLQPAPEFQRRYRLGRRPSRLPAARRKIHLILLMFIPTTFLLITTTAFLCAHLTVLDSTTSLLSQKTTAHFRSTRWPASVLSLIPCKCASQFEESCEEAIDSGEELFQISTTLDKALLHDPCLPKTPAQGSENPKTFMNGLSITKDRIVPFKNAENEFTFGIQIRDRDAHLRSKFGYSPPPYEANPSHPANMDLARYLELYSKRSAALESFQTAAEPASQALPHLHRLYKRRLSAGVWVGVGLGSFLVFIMIIMACCG